MSASHSRPEADRTAKHACASLRPPILTHPSPNRRRGRGRAQDHRLQARGGLRDRRQLFLPTNDNYFYRRRGWGFWMMGGAHSDHAARGGWGSETGWVAYPGKGWWIEGMADRWGRRLARSFLPW
jgi:hypothetical protein